MNKLGFKGHVLYDKMRFLDLWQKSKNGDKGAFKLLADAHYNTLFSYATNFTKDRELIKDTIQELFLRLWEKRENIEIEVVTIYLIKSMRNRMLNNFRRFEFSIQRTDLEEASAIADEYVIENALILGESMSEREQRVHQAIEALPKRQQEVIYLKYYRGFDNEKVAEIMNINKQSVANFLHKALTTLKSQLSAGEFAAVVVYFLYFFPSDNQ